MKTITYIVFALISVITYAQTPFDCNDGNFYQVISGELKAYDPITGNYSEALHTYSSYNAGGYNVQDNFLYAIKSSNKHLLRIGRDQIQDLGAVASDGNIIFGGGYAADVDAQGNLWVFQNNTKRTFHKITNLKDLDGTTSPVFETITANMTAPSTCADITYVNGSFYGGSRGKLFQWDLASGIPVFSSKTVSNLPRSTFGAAYTDASNRLYLSDNNGGLYLINDYNSSTPSAVQLNLTLVTNSNDGFKCANGVSPLDRDRDGVLDSFDLDADGDGILNIDESKGSNPYGDSDDDGMYNYLDNDVSGNGDNTVQNAFDNDNDGVPNFLDSDSDNDGIYDINEIGQSDYDTNNNGVLNGEDANYQDTNFDGLADIFDPNFNGTPVTLIDTDTDGIPNVYDIDSDNDGIVDLIEGQNEASFVAPSGIDADNNGIDNAFDSDFSKNSGGYLDTDTDTIPDYLDTDSDNNGISDSIEAYDSDNNGIADTVLSNSDMDQDGLDDAFDVRKSNFDPQNGGQTPASFPIPPICDRYNYLGEYNNQGTPLYLEARDTVSQESLDVINAALPEGYPVPDFNPHYITSGYDTDILIEQQTAVWVTFIQEGAGYKNTLGFYTYDINNPITETPTPEDITIIFPNVSAKNSGGELETGDKVKIGDFGPNTGIGWVLLADAWSNGCVDTGNWSLFSNYDFNPEAETSLQYHSVLLTDIENERTILGFEDIRRDNASCDNDFNDAVFYITSNPYTSLKTQNLVPIESATNVTSANTGGLESNGDLAKLIAKRNFNRAKMNTGRSQKSVQQKFVSSQWSAKTINGNGLGSYFPSTGMFGTETTFVSSPEDLVDITNADDIFAVDYYLENNRVAAALATATQGSVYDHSKTICDRLNGSSLLDVRTATLRNHTIISTKIQRATGEVEHALSFSVKLNEVTNEIYSFWNIDQYPTGDYLNFQIWGGSVSQVAHIANNIIDRFSETKKLASKTFEDRIPSVFVQKGSYKEGKITLNIINKNKSAFFNFNGNLRRTELSNEEANNQVVALSGAYSEEVTIETGYLFDIGLSIFGEGSQRTDALYLADGPWGIDYDQDAVIVENFEVNEHTNTIDNEAYMVERGASLNGEVKGTVNMFRNLLAGELTLDVNDFSALSFNMNNDIPVEVIIVPKVLANWNNRLRYTVQPSTKITTHNISFSDFKDADGNTTSLENIRNIVFSIQGNFTDYIPFNFEVNDLSISKSAKELEIAINKEENEVVLEIDEQTIAPLEEAIQTASTNVNTMVNYPNPFQEQTTIKFTNGNQEQIEISVFNILGAIVRSETLEQASEKNTFIFKTNNLGAGIYKYLVQTNDGRLHIGSFLIK